VGKKDYLKYRDSPVYGYFLMGKPVLGINDLELVKNVLVKDFNNFVDRNAAVLDEALKSGGELDKVGQLAVFSLATCQIAAKQILDHLGSSHRRSSHIFEIKVLLGIFTSKRNLA